jgi:putative protease
LLAAPSASLLSDGSFIMVQTPSTDPMPDLIEPSDAVRSGRKSKGLALDKRGALELLAPAGDRLCITAAVENGADAVYFGLECGFNARARAANLHVDSLPEVMAFLHERGVRGYVTLNTLVFPSELKAIEQHIVRITEAGVDAVLVQDLGLVRLLRLVSPDLAVHASTQMTLTSAECIGAAEGLGIERVVLARELSIPEIRRIHSQTAAELEVFVHGALCVAYSGQCLTSESLGGRSANRGQCAQACRLPYELVCDGRDVDLGDVKYLLSPQDLAAYALIPELIEAGVSCFKIEGRLKTPEYVANITRHYRRALDAAAAGREARFTEEDVTEMELSFSRGFSPGWLGGCDHKMLVPGLSSAKRGVLAGEVKAIRGQRVVVSARRTVAPGDGVVFAGNREEGDEQGGRVYAVTPCGPSDIELSFGKGAVDFSRLKVGQQLWKTDDPKLTAKLRKSLTGGKQRRRVRLELIVHAAVGRPLRIIGRATNGALCDLESDAPLEAANKHPLSQEILEQQLGRLGKTVYELRHLRAEIVGGPMVPLSVLGTLRHRMIDQLTVSAASQPARRIAKSADFAPAIREHEFKSDISRPTLRVLCRTLGQLEAAAGCGINSLFVDFQDIRDYRLAAQAASDHGAKIYLATPRIQKPGESGIFHAMSKHGANGFLVRNLAGMAFCAERRIPFVCDFSLNAANQWTVDYLRSCGAERVTISYDLNRDQLLDLVNAVPTGWLEAVIHQHMPMFHMEHCVFCAVLSPGTNKTNCGRPCDVHAVKLRDRVGMEHVLQADVGCRNTLFNAVPQSAAELVPMLLSKGVRDVRIELLSETEKEARTVIGLYQELLDGRIGGKQIWQRLRAANRVGVTRGTLEERRNPLAIL